jgi:hypothetical protein
MADGGLLRGVDRLHRRLLVDHLELGRLARSGMRHAHQLQERFAGLEAFRIGVAVERVARHHLAPGRDLALRPGSRKSRHFVAAIQQPGDEASPHVARAPRDENAHAHFLQKIASLLREKSWH